MDIHKPHAAKSWREFAIEIGTIVVGILIALSLEQLVETLHERRVTAEAREAVRGELSADLAWMQQRADDQACLERRLSELDAILAAARAGRPYPVPRWIGRSMNQPVSARRWTAASNSGRASLFSSGEQAQYASIYFTVERFIAAEDEEADAWAILRSAEGVAAMPPAMAWGLTEALARARFANYLAKRTADRAFEAAGLLGVRPGPRAAKAGLDLKRPPLCVPIDTDRATAVKMIGNPSGEP
jgi:hypothetical protein